MRGMPGVPCVWRDQIGAEISIAFSCTNQQSSGHTGFLIAVTDAVPTSAEGHQAHLLERKLSPVLGDGAAPIEGRFHRKNGESEAFS